ncbi:heat shock 70 kDa protein 12A-like [Dreissena polymorpha]|uniref:Heat shock 70 kDa protein 12A n=1 Tax=Dreissena polymorpha TaxID=45954 RepID=A0A9D4JQ00_DREPO|nr:heat shock 70 kDa protein 12A-like [Dreissena polymorpha]XP_052212988.1 heat shock 70 kDa protein 12A-like [Dreissena polymorpha]XP_052212989.1 heat shock 70 kDa protein 12A-like [Dreissena polymorpha]KAH3818539.1 hypothetical protein DPMN_120260 [Dreissena polymorpha]
MVLAVASIDFGTTYSGWAYSFTHEYEKDPIDIKAKHWNADQFISNKAPTCVLIHSDGKTVDSFGYRAENKYEELAQKNEHKTWYYFKHFKMKLFNNLDLRKQTMLEDATGKQLPALTVIAAFIKFLKDDLMEVLKDRVTGGFTSSDVNWVLTVPAIWNERAKQFMRMAAREAGIETGHLSIALEPEAASIFCRHSKLRKSDLSTDADISTFPPGTQYIVCDAGGGTVDITVHEVTGEKALKEVDKASGGAWGGTQVDAEFEKLMDTIAGCALIQRLKEEYMDDYMDLKRTFEVKKRDLKTSSSIVLRIPSIINELVSEMTGCSLQDQIQKSVFKNKISRNRDKLTIDLDVIESLFGVTIRSITEHLSSLLSKHIHIAYIVMVGGFSESTLLQQRVKDACPGKHVIIPAEAGLAVLKGAVMFGHNKRCIISRIARYTYGISAYAPFDESIHPASRLWVDKDNTKWAKNTFSKHIELGQQIPIDQSANSCIYDSIAVTSYIHIFASHVKSPVFADDKGNFLIGEFRLRTTDESGKMSQFKVDMYFGGTEIQVKAVLLSNGKETEVTVDLPD